MFLCVYWVSVVLLRKLGFILGFYVMLLGVLGILGTFWGFSGVFGVLWDFRGFGFCGFTGFYCGFDYICDFGVFWVGECGF